jgi:hypothetical protein
MHKCIAIMTALAAANLQAADVHDVVIYGGSAAGAAAAVQTARMGRSVIVIEPGRHIGGLTSGGLGMTDSGNRSVIGGLSREFYQRLKRHYDHDDAWRQEKRAAYRHYSAKNDAIWRFEPGIAEKTLREMLAEQKVPLVFGERLDLKNGVEIAGGRIASIRMESGRVFKGRVFIDATYEGDLMAKAGVTYTVGREANSQYDETLNGVQTRHARGHQFMKPVDPYVEPGNPASGLLPGVHGDGPGEPGAADHRVQAYCFRMCLTDAPDNRLPFPKPKNYDAKRYELYLRYIQAGWRNVFGNHKLMPNRKTDTNNHGAFSTDNIGMNYDYPDGDYAVRERIVREHETYQKGLMWFLANDPRVAPELQRVVRRWGLAKDEFTDNGNWPHQLYIREARRMVSEYVISERDCRRLRETPESVGMGSYNMDSHNVQRYVDKNGHARNEGDVQINPGGPYKISYLSIRPKSDECTNLLVPICLSSSHIAYGSIRMEPVFMVLGQSAATAAVFAIEADSDVQAVTYEKLKPRLIADGQVLEYSRAAVQLVSDKLPGVVVDEDDAKQTGAWKRSTSISPYVDNGYLHDGNQAKGAMRLRYTAKIAKAGRYEVRFYFSHNSNRATNVPVTVESADGEKRVTVNQTKSPRAGKAYAVLGAFPYEAGTASVTVSNVGTKGFVVADAVQWVEVK